MADGANKTCWIRLPGGCKGSLNSKDGAAGKWFDVTSQFEFAKSYKPRKCYARSRRYGRHCKTKNVQSCFNEKASSCSAIEDKKAKDKAAKEKIEGV